MAFAPVQNMSPDVVTRKEWLRPQAPVRNRFPSMSSFCGLYRLNVSPTPSCPSSFRPHEYATPVPEIMMLWLAIGPEMTVLTGTFRMLFRR